jgi:DNA-binding CsgD family transcriptional regulator
VTLLVIPPETHPTSRLFEGSAGLVRERILHLNVLDDGSLVLLGLLRGELDRVGELLAGERGDVLDYSLSPTEAGAGLLYVHVRPPPPVVALLAVQRHHGVFFERPIDATRDGRLRLVLVAQTDERLRRAVADVPPELDATIERVGDYPADPRSVGAMLTDRQREVLGVARELGYYEVPRRATHRDIADRLGLSVGTVSEHLQKVEARVFGAIVG